MQCQYGSSLKVRYVLHGQSGMQTESSMAPFQIKMCVEHAEDLILVLKLDQYKLPHSNHCDHWRAPCDVVAMKFCTHH